MRRRIRRWILVLACCLAVFGGVILARWFVLPDARWLWLIVPPLMLALCRQNLTVLLLFVVLFGGIGWWRGSVYMQRLGVHETLHYQKVILVGQAVDDAVYGKRAQLEFSADRIRVLEPQVGQLVGSLTIRGFGESAIYRGDVVHVEGKLYPTLGNNLGSISFAKLQVEKRDAFWLNDFRRKFAAGMQSALPEPLASFGMGLLIGQRSTLPEDVSKQLQYVGLTHIIAVSGYNLTIIVMACRRWLAKRSKYQATFACLALIGIFLLLTGSSPPIVRAAIISVLSIGVWYYGRTIKPLVLLLLAAAMTVIANPIYLWSSVSWWLSFLAFFGVLVLAPLVAKRLFPKKEMGILAGVLLESACATLMVLPYILYIFGQMSLVVLPANLLVVPLIPFAMLFGAVAGLAGMLLPAIAGWLAWPANIVMTFMLDVASLLSRVPHAFVDKIDFPLASMIACYFVLAGVSLLLWNKGRQNGRITEKIQE